MRVLEANVICSQIELIILYHSVVLGRPLRSDRINNGQGDNQSDDDVPASVDHLPTMWLGAQSGRSVPAHYYFNYYFIRSFVLARAARPIYRN